MRDQFRKAGFIQARRGQQFSGEQGNPDVIVPELPSLHFEGKFTQRCNLYDWMAQAINDAYKTDTMPIVCHRRNGEEWLAILHLEDFLTLVKETDRVKL